MIVPVAIRELVQCEWCSVLMTKTEADVLCVSCASSFADRLLPPGAVLCGEEIPQIKLNSEFEDSKYGSELVDDDRSEASTKDPIDAGTGGCGEYYNFPQHCKMYEKIASLWHLEKEAIPLADDTWAMMCHLNVLSRCYVDYGGSLVKFGLLEIRGLFRNLSGIVQWASWLSICTSKDILDFNCRARGSMPIEIGGPLLKELS